MNEEDIAREQALVLVERAYRHQMNNEYADAILLYKRSIALCPTAEAYTFLGWTYSMLGRYEEAMEACFQAIEVDPTFGNPYNDIGVYLMEMGRWEEAIPWLEKAMAAPRYEVPEYPRMNLGRVYEHMGDFRRALACYDEALAINPFYFSAERTKRLMLAKLN